MQIVSYRTYPSPSFIYRTAAYNFINVTTACARTKKHNSITLNNASGKSSAFSGPTYIYTVTHRPTPFLLCE